MKRIYLLLFIISLFFIFNGCSQKVTEEDLIGGKWIGTAGYVDDKVNGEPYIGCTNSDKIANERIEYHNNDWLAFKKMNDEMLGPIESEFIILATGKDLQGTEFLIKEEILPALSELVDYLEGIKLEHKVMNFIVPIYSYIPPACSCIDSLTTTY